MLDWLELPGLRRQATVELNKGEARNALARAVCFHRLGRLRDRAVEAQQYRASGLALVTAAIALWNTVYLDRALDDLRCSSEMISEGRDVDGKLVRGADKLAQIGIVHLQLVHLVQEESDGFFGAMLIAMPDQPLDPLQLGQ
jgi:Tn3 transposase DDE domain